MKRLGALLLLLCCAVAGAAQTTKEQRRGFMPGGSYTLGDVETISNSNGNVMLNVPLARLPAGRGGMPGAGLSLIYNSKLWDPEPVAIYGSPYCSGGGGCTYPLTGVSTFLKDNKHGGWSYAYGYTMEVIDRRNEGRYPYGGAPSCNANGGGVDHSGARLFKVRIRFPDGSMHEFHPTGRSGLEHTDGYYNFTPDGNFYTCQVISGGSYAPNYGAVGSGPSYGTPNTYYTADGTYLKLVTVGTSNVTVGQGQVTGQHWTLYFPDGTRVTTNPSQVGNGGQRVYDRNNNFVQFGGNAIPGQPDALISDQLGRAIRLTYGAEGHVITASGTGGEALQWVVKWRGASLRNKTFHTGYHGQITYNWGWSVVESVTPPAQSGLGPYLFDYNDKDAAGGSTGNSVGWGELSSVTLPTGAKARYTYKQDGVTDPNSSAFQVLQNHPIKKELTYLSEHDGESSEVTDTWRYSYYFSGLDTISTSTSVTAPDGGVTSEYFINNPGHWDHGLVRSMSLPDGTLVVKVWQENRLGDWMDTSNNYRVEMNPSLKTEYRTVPGSNNTSQTAITEYSYDKNGNVLQVKEYDWVPYSSFPRDQFGGVVWGIPAGAVPKRVTTNTYYNPTPGSSTQASNANSYDKATSPILRNALASAQVSDGAGQPLSRSEFTYDNPSTTGNQTLRRSWDSTKGALLSPQGGTRLNEGNSVSVSSEYDDNTADPALRYGNVTLSVDANGNRTRYTYGAVTRPDGVAFTGLYPTAVVTAEGTGVQRTSSSVYDHSTGLVTKATDDDNQVSTSITYDALGRATLVEEADDQRDENNVSLERRTVTEYSGALRRVVVRSDLNTTGDGKLVSVQHFDQLGRVRLSRTLEDVAAQSETAEADGIKVQTRYKFSGPNSYTVVSNPYRAATAAAATGEETMGWTLSASDRAGRLVRVETFAGAGLPAPFAAANPNAATTGAVVTAYDAQAVTVTDQAGKSRRSLTDALGRLAQVIEAPDAEGYKHQTTYAYDALSNLTQVMQGVQTRTFAYSSLSRLVSAVNPEACQQQPQGQCVPVPVTYEYDPNGNLRKRTDARGVVTEYFYDELNRVKKRSHSDGTPEVTYAYDAAGVAHSRGRLTSVVNSVSTNSYTAYDALGRVKSSAQTTGVPTTGVQTYTMRYDYNLAGGLKSQTYPSGRVVVTEYDAAGRVAGARNEATSHYYAGGASPDEANRIRYAAHGAAATTKLGNGLWEQTQFNSRLQPTRLWLGTAAPVAARLRLDYGYGAGDNNGSVRTQTITVPGLASPLTQSYGYDALNRLETAEEKAGTTPVWKQVYKYDRYGNRTLDAATTYPAVLDGANNPAVSPSTNRITSAGYAYDAAGNLLCDPARPCGAGGAAYYSYDAENKMAAAGGGAATGGATYQYDGEGRRVKKVVGAQTTVFVYDAAGRLAAEYGDQSASNGVSYLTQDNLGSTRIVTGADGQPKSRHDYFPFGEEIPASMGGRHALPAPGYNFGTVTRKFTGKERDNETGLDYFGARYYSNIHGRFTGVDQGPPEMLDPQTWNRYQYARNNPLYYVDPDGNVDTPARDQRINNALALDPTLLEVIRASNNFSQRAFESNLWNQSLTRLNGAAGNELRGLAGEAEVIDYMRAGFGFSVVTSNPLSAASNFLSSVTGVNIPLPDDIAPDIGAAFVAGSARVPKLGTVETGFQLGSIVQGAGGMTGTTRFSPNVKFMIGEVKAGTSTSGIRDGANQIAAYAQFLRRSKLPGVAVLIVDGEAWSKMGTRARTNAFNKVNNAGGYIQVINGLSEAAADRAREMVQRGRQSVR